jgi:hypothetical protein
MQGRSSKYQIMKKVSLVLIIYRMRDLEDREIEEGVEGGIKLPSVEIARTFAVETIDYPNPMGLQ